MARLPIAQFENIFLEDFMKGTVKKKKENRHIYGVFLRMVEMNKNNSRIAVMEIPSGEFIEGVLPTEAIRRVKLRNIISVDLTGIRPIRDINKIVFHKNYNIQPSVYPRDIDETLL